MYIVYCICASCGLKKKKRKLNQPVQGAGIGSTLGEMELEGVIIHAILWLGKKSSRNGSI